MKTFARTLLLLIILFSFTTCDYDSYWEEGYFDCVFESQTAPQGYFSRSANYSLRDIYFVNANVYGSVQDIYLQGAVIEIECLNPSAKNWNDYIDYVTVTVAGLGSFIFSDSNYRMPSFGNSNFIQLSDPNFDRFMAEAMIYILNNGYDYYTTISVDASLVTYGAFYYPLKISLLNDLDVKIRDF